MKFATFILDGRERVGLVDPEAGTVRPIAALDMIDLIPRFEEFTARGVTDSGEVALGDVELIAPIPRPPRNVFCVGKNYREHAREFAGSGYEAGAIKGSEIDAFPAVFTKPASSVVGHGATVDLHSGVTSEVDYEAELAVVIGRGGRDIAPEAARDHIFGYTIVNDVTARDRQKNHKQWFLGKALDTFCPMGPWVTTADEVDDRNIDILTTVNGETRQNANTRDLIFDVPTLISTISAGLTLEPGDVIATGTPAGVGIGFDPPKFLASGDVVTISMSGLGVLSNPFA